MMTRRGSVPLMVPVVLLLAGACEMASVTPDPASFAPPASASTAAASASPPAPTPPPIELPPDVATWCRQNVGDVYAVTEGLGIPSDPRPFRLTPDNDLGWRPVEGSRNYQVGCTAAYEERASAPPS